jgi:hypothetical protein
MQQSEGFFQPEEVVAGQCGVDTLTRAEVAATGAGNVVLTCHGKGAPACTAKIEE